MCDLRLDFTAYEASLNWQLYSYVSEFVRMSESLSVSEGSDDE